MVDASGRVHGTQQLFVVDASIMPTVPSGFTHLPTIMIGERLSEQIAASLSWPRGRQFRAPTQAPDRAVRPTAQAVTSGRRRSAATVVIAANPMTINPKT